MVITIISIIITGIITNSGVAYADFYANYTKPGSKGIPLSKSQLIGIQLDKVCLTLIKNNMPNKCPHYDVLSKFDNTNQMISGKLKQDKNGIVYRDKPQIKNHYNFYPNLQYIVMVDPDPDFTTRARMIYITTDNFTISDPLENGDNHTRSVYVNRDPLSPTNCSTVTVAPYLDIINDTISFLESGCTVTHYNNKITYKIPVSKTDLKNPYSSLLQMNYSKSILNGHYSNYNHTAGGNGPGNCITAKVKCPVIKNPYAKW